MPYLMTDDGFPDHPKVDPLSDGAYRLHSAGMHYCAKNLTDGRIPAARVPRMKPGYRPGQLRELVAAGLWHEGGEGCGTEHCLKGEAGEYVVHDYLEWNKSKSWWETKRRSDADRLARWRARNERGSQHGT